MNCPRRVVEALQSVKEVVTAKVDYKTKSATVIMKKAACGKDNVKRLTDALDKAGYGGKLIKKKSETVAPKKS